MVDALLDRIAALPEESQKDTLIVNSSVSAAANVGCGLQGCSG